VVVLDQVDAGAGEGARHLGQRRRRRADRLERGTGQRSRRRADARAHAGDAVVRPAEGTRQRRRQRRVEQLEVGVQRAVAEQHVHQLAGVGADRLDAERKLRQASAVGLRFDAFDARHDLAQHAFVAHRFGRHLDALLEREHARALRRVRGRRVQAIGHQDARVVHRSGFYGRRLAAGCGGRRADAGQPSRSWPHARLRSP
jgi:hypothetical protein